MGRYGGMKVTRKLRSARWQYQQVQDEVRGELKDVGKAHVDARKRVVANWEHQPDFYYQVGIGAKMLYVWIKIRNAAEALSEYGATIGDLWKWISQTGTKKHIITPRKAGGVLAFPWGGPRSYKSKTGASPARYGGPGTVTGAQPSAFAYVEHPGFPPRYFDRDINTDLKPYFDTKVDRGYKRGFRKATQAHRS